MKKLLIPLLLFGFLIAPSVKAETVLYCQTEFVEGWIQDNGSWRKANFGNERYTIKFNNDFSRLEGIAYNAMDCSVPYKSRPNQIFCVHLLGSHETFIYHKTTKRFVFANLSTGGYSRNAENADSESMEAGTCKEF